MGTDNPIDLLVSEYLPAVEASAVETGAVEAQVASTLPEVRTLAELKTPVYGNDPNELIKHRFLYRGGIALLCGPTGIGKSSFLLQFAIHLAAGQALFGIEPGDTFNVCGMKVLLIQAENDEGDLAEMRDGVIKGCEELTDEQREQALANIKVVTVCDKTGDAFGMTLAVLLKRHGPFDLVMVDPAFAYLGGDSNSQKDVSHFMREILNPLVQKHRIGLLLAHHTNKPLRGKEKEGWAAGDYAYLGAGSAEWINPARAALAIRSLGSEDVFELRAVKRGRRLRWTDAEGQPTNARLIAHDKRPGVICWREATELECALVAAKPAPKAGRPKLYQAVDAVRIVKANPGESENGYSKLLSLALGCSPSQGKGLLGEAVDAGWLATRLEGGCRRYSVTDAGEACGGGVSITEIMAKRVY